MNTDATTAGASPYKVWDRVKVSKTFFDHCFQHPVFRAEPKAINTAQYWLTAIDAAIERNDDNPVTWDWKDIQDRFRPYNRSHTVYRDALRDLGLLSYTPYRPPANDAAQGECRNFTITPLGRSLLSGGNYQWLYNLLKDPQTRRRNQVAVSKRKRTRTVYADPMMQIIDAFRYAVKFDEDGYLKQLEHDKEACFGRFSAALHGLLAFERKRFGELELKEGRIYHEFVVLPRAYRPFGSSDYPLSLWREATTAEKWAGTGSL